MTTVPVTNNENTETISLGRAVIKVHFWAYRGICRQIERAVSTVFFNILEPPVSAGFQQARKISLIDYFYTSTLRAVNAVGEQIIEHRPFTEEHVKTLKQLEKEQEARQFKEQLGRETVYPEFCSATASYINTVIPKLIAEEMGALPAFGEGWLLWRCGIIVRYLNRQLGKRFEHRNAVISSVFGERISANFDGIRSRFAQKLVGRHNLEPLLSFEHLLLNICVKLTGGNGEGNQTPHLVKTAIRSLGNSLSMQDEIATFLAAHPYGSEENQMIARLEKHQQSGTLPKGVPDPSQVQLNSANLSEELDKALTERIKGLVRIILEKVAPSSLKRGLLGMVYWLEGKDFLVDLLSFLIVEFGIKQLVDPHLFALAILRAGGEETADFETDGFGREQMETLAHIGQEMMKEALNPGSHWQSLRQLFKSSNLRSAPGGYEELMQKIEAKERLREYIFQLIYQMVKGDDLKYDSLLKGVRERASKLPLVGAATLALHGTINGMFLSFVYLIRDEKYAENSFLTWMTRNFTGSDQCRFFADKIVDLIYHPSWRITLLRCIDDVEEAILNPPQLQSPEEAPYGDVDLTPITNFIFQHFIRDSNLPFEGSIVPLIHYYSEEGLKTQFQQLLKPSEGSLFETVLTEFLPTMKELKLYCRLLVSFRDQCVWFEGDEKFWEFFIRESLNRLTAIHVMEEHGPDADLPQAALFEIRNEYVEKMLSMDDAELRSYLSDIPKCSEFLHQWDMVEDDEPTVSLAASSSGIVFIENYKPE